MVNRVMPVLNTYNPRLQTLYAKSVQPNPVNSIQFLYGHFAAQFCASRASGLCLTIHLGVIFCLVEASLSEIPHLLLQHNFGRWLAKKHQLKGSPLNGAGRDKQAYAGYGSTHLVLQNSWLWPSVRHIFSLGACVMCSTGEDVDHGSVVGSLTNMLSVNICRRDFPPPKYGMHFVHLRGVCPCVCVGSRHATGSQIRGGYNKISR